MLIGQIREDREINPVLGEALSVLGHTEILEPAPATLRTACRLADFTGKGSYQTSSKGDTPKPKIDVQSGCLPGIPAFFYQRQHTIFRRPLSPGAPRPGKP